jgi:Ice-binding-like
MKSRKTRQTADGSSRETQPFNERHEHHHHEYYYYEYRWLWVVLASIAIFLACSVTFLAIFLPLYYTHVDDDLTRCAIANTCGIDGRCWKCEHQKPFNEPTYCYVNDSAVGLPCDDQNSSTVGDACAVDGTCVGVQCQYSVQCILPNDTCHFTSCINNSCVYGVRPHGFVCSPNGTCINGTCMEHIACHNASQCPIYHVPNATITSSSVASGFASPLPVLLGLAGDFVALAKSGISTTGATTIIGNIGVSPAAATTITGFGLVLSGSYATSSLVTGRVYAADYAPPTPAYLTTAVLNMQAAYVDAAGRLADVTGLGAGTLSTTTLTTGVYKWSTAVVITGDITLSGSATDVWIFQISGTLTINSGVSIILSGGALASNVFWQVAGVVSFDATTHIKGIVLGATAVTMTTGSTIDGKLFSETAITMSGETAHDIEVPVVSCMTAHCVAGKCSYIPCV